MFADWSFFSGIEHAVDVICNNSCTIKWDGWRYAYRRHLQIGSLRKKDKTSLSIKN